MRQEDGELKAGLHYIDFLTHTKKLSSSSIVGFC